MTSGRGLSEFRVQQMTMTMESFELKMVWYECYLSDLKVLG